MSDDQMEELEAVNQRLVALHPRELWHAKWPTLAADLSWLVMEVARLRKVNAQLRYELEIARLRSAPDLVDHPYEDKATEAP